jgi:hypothetical protein
MICRHFLPLALLLSAAFSSDAQAIDDVMKGAARELANEAKRDFDAANYDEAARKFGRAYDLAKVPTLAVWAAKALVQRGKLVAASELYRQATLLAPNELWIGNVQQEAQSQAHNALDQLLPRIPKLTIRVRNTSLELVDVSMNDVRIAPALVGLPIPCDPGVHRIVGRAGMWRADRAITLTERQRAEVSLDLGPPTPVAQRGAIAMLNPVPQSSPMPLPIPQVGQPNAVAAPPPSNAPYQQGGAAPLPPSPPPHQQEMAPPPSSLPPQNPSLGPASAFAPKLAIAAAPTPAPPSSHSPRQTWGRIAIVVGAVGVVVGAVAGIIVMSNSDLRDSCPNDTCDSATTGGSSVDRYNLMRTLSTAGFIVGGVATAAAVTLILWPSQDSDAAPRAAIWLGPNSAGLKGRF